MGTIGRAAWFACFFLFSVANTHYNKKLAVMETNMCGVDAYRLLIFIAKVLRNCNVIMQIRRQVWQTITVYTYLCCISCLYIVKVL